MRGSLAQQNLKKLDRSNMLELLLDFPQQCKAAVGIAEGAKILLEKKDFSQIIFAGLGGSAIGADFVRSYLYFETKIPIQVFREYTLPNYIGSFTLAFVSSYSGNTEETISAYQEAKERGASLIVISSGGLLKEYALKDNVTFIQIPAGSPPRCALGYLSIIPLCVLSRLGLIKDVRQKINAMVGVLEELKNNSLNPRIGQKDNIAKACALKLFNRFTVIYSASVHFDICATRFRGQLAENSKALSSSHLFPEMNHNEIVGWENPKKLLKDFAVVMLRDKDMHPRVVKRMDVTKDILRRAGVRSIIEVFSRGEDLLSRIFSLVYIADFVSYYLAILYGIDPQPVERVTYLKNQLAKG